VVAGARVAGVDRDAVLVGRDQAASEPAHFAVGVADLDRDRLADCAPEMLRTAEGALEAGAAHLERERPEVGERVERGLDAFGRRRDRVEVDAAVTVDDHAHGASASRAGELDVEELEAERREQRFDGGDDRFPFRHRRSPPRSTRPSPGPS
jgi:hypothetical protein